MIGLLKQLVLRYQYRGNMARGMIINRALDFWKHTHVKGDYFEFGVFQGAVTQYIFRAARLRRMSPFHIYAFDSFKGFGRPTGKDDTTGILVEGGRACSEEDFMRGMRAVGAKDNGVTTIPGFFEETLVGAKRDETIHKIGSTKAAIVYVDCDLYEPTRDVLDFITPYLVNGSVLIFDDWFLFKGDPRQGERCAFEEWAQKNPQFTFTQFYKFGWHGESFIVNMQA
ncbi:MAG: TylF/MycF/NovP-related O-methyltransferase [Patescibacteria group bacterium]